MWKGKASEDKAVRRLARNVAGDWKWATGNELPAVRADSELWDRKAMGGAHPLWVALDAAKLCVGWGAVRVLTNYALKKYPSAGRVGLWTLDTNIFV